MDVNYERIESVKTKNQCNLILKKVVYVCFSKITSSSPTKFRVTKGLYNH
jgi:hypothetical protein